MTLAFNTWQRSVAFGVLCILAVVYIVATSTDETHLGKASLNAPGSPAEAVYQHAVSSGFGIIGLQPENATIAIQTHAIYHARSAFLLMAYTFLRKVYTDPGCTAIDDIQLHPYAYLLNTEGFYSLGPFAEILIARSGAGKIDWSKPYPDLHEFHESLTSHGTIRYDKKSVP
jgi:hypothetical protein